MFELLDFLLIYSPDFDYLLPIASQYFSNRLLKIYKEKEFLSLSAEKFILILLQERNANLDTLSFGRVCAEWICHEYQNRIKKLKDLVNATRYRCCIIPYCHFEPNMKIESWQKNHSSNEPDVAMVEKYFNELLHSLGEAKFGTPSELTDKLNLMRSGDRVVFPTDPIVQWVSLLDEEILCDVEIIVQGTTFKLHRIKLSSVSGYFYELFTKTNEPLLFEIDKPDDELWKLYTHALDQIDPETFRSIVQYIYREEIEVTSKNHLNNLLKASKFLKMDELYEECSLRFLNLPGNYFPVDIVEMFQYACEKRKYSELKLYDHITLTLSRLWPKLDKNPQLLNISLDALTKIVALPDLEIDNTDQLLDLCSKWIFHDVQNRYKYTIEIAKAINRNFTMDTEKVELEIPPIAIDFSQQYVKQQLIRILSLTVLVPANTKNIQKDELKPCFLTLGEDHSLRVLDANFNVITRLLLVDHHRFFLSSATVIHNNLFILFRNDDFKFYFQLYHISSNTMIGLTSDDRMNHFQNFIILSCNNEVYFCDDKIILKYSAELNRWIGFLKFDEGGEKQYTSDGERLYKIFSSYNEKTKEWKNKASYYDFEQNVWIALPNIPIKTESIMKGKANIIKGELSVLFKSRTFSFNWITQKWTSVSNCCENFIEFTADRRNVLYVSDKNEVYLYAPVRNEWTFKKKLVVSGLVRTIHKIDHK